MKGSCSCSACRISAIVCRVQLRPCGSTFRSLRHGGFVKFAGLGADAYRRGTVVEGSRWGILCALCADRKESCTVRVDLFFDAS